MVEIRDRDTGAHLFQLDAETMAGANLRGKSLARAELTGGIEPTEPRRHPRLGSIWGSVGIGSAAAGNAGRDREIDDAQDAGDEQASESCPPCRGASGG